MHLSRIPFFRIWYSTTFTVLFILIICLLGATPADQVYQSIQRESSRSSKIQTIIVISATYVLTILVTLFVYASRLYTNRAVLASIPKWYIPIENGDIGKGVRKMILKQLEQSAIVAWDVRPRDIREDNEIARKDDDQQVVTRKPAARRNHHTSTATVIPISKTHPLWWEIGHPGWSSPTATDFPNLYFRPIVAELPNLIEAKAVSMAPPDPSLLIETYADGDSPRIPNARAVALLQRPATIGLRSYLAHLCSFGMADERVTQDFLTIYERARFSPVPLSENSFRELMEMFSIVLANMIPINTTLLEEVLQDDASRLSTSESASPASSAIGRRSLLHTYDGAALTKLSRSTAGLVPQTATIKDVSLQTFDAEMRHPSVSTQSDSSIRRNPMQSMESLTSSDLISEEGTRSMRSGESVIYSPRSHHNTSETSSQGNG